ncbi:uncharacterized protein B0P05DRAFT_545637 [Gilbertella persicaria]|uniref:Tubulin-specific chaperone A n=1 Tax=Rhizopus stolonifer TaxID=4846 RepID=A0A367KVD1_RHIST|nr:uncharacterized protein B0P05DRAFT_545637 [Gilbertella persicaria]KAI8076731.1 hypothetical protein B0P05DRAFT_545637 [Gilbertella persicaria]RCI06161.1 hypothetical protein CU098_008692 [Rhizopus stolonifer]
MPMQKDLEQIHNELQQILKESRSLTQKKKYSSEEIQGLQERLSKIDAQYKEGIIDDRNKNDANDDPYEHDGQAQVADDLAKVHQTLSQLLDRTE